ncbi:hypothetical protein E3N88_22712 [Mikania micrantha]|uniref:Uncharacterized protein n=1 Tax=Mikania micrantha TaxID=192012 RepID=A0A5N6NB85_9ASTR|nr:hypothetical protein E3N88_22712 [Mikania micrantha]
MDHPAHTHIHVVLYLQAVNTSPPHSSKSGRFVGSEGTTGWFANHVGTTGRLARGKGTTGRFANDRGTSNGFAVFSDASTVGGSGMEKVNDQEKAGDMAY